MLRKNNREFFLTVRLCANYADAIVTVQQIGVHACGFNGFKTSKDVKFPAKHNDRLELLYGKYAYEIEFNPPPRMEHLAWRKRSYESEETGSKAKMLKLENNSEEEEEQRQSSSNDSFKQKESDAGSSTISGESNSDSSVAAKWESFDSGKLLIYTASSMQNRSKVILTALKFI